MLLADSVRLFNIIMLGLASHSTFQHNNLQLAGKPQASNILVQGQW